jgi:prophage regulatory protein
MPPKKPQHPTRVVREAEREEITGIPTSTWYLLQNKGLAPLPIPLGERSVGWLLHELLEFIDRRREERDAKRTVAS